MFLTPHVSASVITSDLLRGDLKEAAQAEGDEHRARHERNDRESVSRVLGGLRGWGADETRLKSQPLKSRWKM